MASVEPETISAVVPFLAFTSMVPDDIPHVLSIEERSFPTPWSALSYRRELLENEASHYWAIRTVTAECALPPLLAYGGYWILGDEAHISTIASHPDFRRCKLGEWLLLAMMNEARRHGCQGATLEVRIGNDVAIGLYTTLGFQEVGLRKKYYASTGTQPAEDALLLTLFDMDQGRVWRPLARRLAQAREQAQMRLWPYCEDVAFDAEAPR